MAKTFQFGFVIEGDAERGTKTVRRFKEEVASLEKGTQGARKRTQEWSAETEKANSQVASATKLVQGLAGALAAYGGVRLAATAIQDFRELELGLVGVSKTTGLAGQELDQFKQRIYQISREIPVTTNELLELAQSAGQMGVTGADNLEKFSLVVAKLGRASDLAGEEAAKSLARILNVTGENISEIDVLASVIVSLGNNVAATESEIARMTTEVARSTSAYGVSSAEAAGMAAAMAAIGIQAEAGGSAVGRAMQVITLKVQAGGKDLNDFAKALGLNADELTRLFQENRTEAFRYFLESVSALGLDAGNALKEVGLGGQEIAKSIIPLANNLQILEQTMSLANAEVANATALDREFEATLDSLDSQILTAQNILKGYRLELAQEFVPQINEALKAFNEWGAADGPEKAMAATQKAVELLAIAISARLIGPVLYAGTAMAGAAAKSLLYNGGLTSLERSLMAATIQQRLLNIAVESGNKALALVGGPGGAILLAAGAIYTFREQLGLAKYDAEQAAGAIEGLRLGLEKLTSAQIQVRAEHALQEYLDAAKELERRETELAIKQEAMARNRRYQVDPARQRELTAIQAEIDTARQNVVEASAVLGDLARAHNSLGVAADESASSLDNYSESVDEASNLTGTLASKIQDQILKYRQRLAALQLGARNQAIYNALIEAGTEATQEDVKQIVEHVGAIFDREEALREQAAAFKDNTRQTKKLSEESERMHRQMQEDWAETRREFGSFFADMVQQGNDAFDALLKSFERMLLEMTGQLALSGLAKMFGFDVPGGGAGGIKGVLDSSGFAGDVTGTLISKFGSQFANNAGLSEIYAALNPKSMGPVMPGQGINTELLVSGLKTLGLSIGAGIAGGYAGGELGKALFGKEAESSIGQSIGTAIGTYFGGPIGALIGSTLGSMVDVATGGDGKTRQNAGFLVAPTPGADSSRLFDVERFESGLQVQGFARRADQAAARDVINVFRDVDAIAAQLLRALGGTLDLTKASLNGLNEEAQLGSSGTFLGLGGNGTLAGDLQAQLSLYINQLLDHTQGLSDELIGTVRAAGSAEEAIALLAEALVEHEAATAQSAEAAERAKKVVEDLRLAEEKLLNQRTTNVATMAQELQSAISLQRSIQSSIYEALGATPLFGMDETIAGQIAMVAEHRNAIIRQHEEQMKAELALHNQRLALARSFADYTRSLRMGDMSNLSPEAKLELAQERFRALSEAAKSGDQDALTQLQAAADQYISAADDMWASSTGRQNVVDEVLSTMDLLSSQLAKSVYDPSAANAELVRKLSALDQQLSDISRGINESIIAELKDMNLTLSELAPKIQESLLGAVSQWIATSKPAGDAIVAALGGLRGSVDLLPPEIASFMSASMGAMIQAMLASGRAPSYIANTIPAGSLPDSAADAYLGGAGLGATADYRTSDAAIRAYVGDVNATAASELDAIQRVHAAAIANGIGSAQLAKALNTSQQDILAMAAKAGLPSFSGGGIATGPDSGYLAILHGTEKVTPMKNGRDETGEAMLAEMRALRQEVLELKRATQNVGLDASRQRDQQKRINEGVREELSKLSTRRAGGFIG
jgi:TP901 family phage tail tape measure protein